MDAGDTVTWSLSGADSAKFAINSATGAVTFVSSPDFETPNGETPNGETPDAETPLDVELAAEIEAPAEIETGAAPKPAAPAKKKKR